MNGTMRQKAPLLAAALVLLLAAAWLYGRIYHIEADSSNLPQAAEEWLSRGSPAPSASAVELRQSLDIGGTRFVLAELSDSADLYMAMFRLERGLNGRYKIARSAYGSGSFQQELFRDRDHAYYLLGGRNRLLDIREASFTMEDEGLGRTSYQMNIPPEDYFLTMTEIDPGFRADHEEPGSLRFYNGAGEDVTRQALP